MRKVHLFIVGAVLNLLFNITAGLIDRATAIRITRWGWLYFLLHATYLAASGERSLQISRTIRAKFGKAVMTSYIIVALCGAGLAVLYWTAINRAYGALFPPPHTESPKTPAPPPITPTPSESHKPEAPEQKPSQTPQQTVSKLPKPITKFDNFVALVPLNASVPTAPIPLDEDQSDPHLEFYLGLFQLATRSQIVGSPPPASYELATDDDRSRFVTRLMQMFVFHSLFHMTRQSFGVRLTPGQGVTPINTKAVIPPEDTSYPTDSLLKELSSHPLFNRPIELLLRNFPIHLPRNAKFVFSEDDFPKEGRPFTCAVRIVRDGYFTIDVTAMPAGATNEGNLPAGFKSVHAPTTRAESVAMTMRASIERRHDDDFDPEVYAAWASGLFTELRKRISY